MMRDLLTDMPQVIFLKSIYLPIILRGIKWSLENIFLVSIKFYDRFDTDICVF